nr:protein cornichon like 4 [Quercus suber]
MNSDSVERFPKSGPSNPSSFLAAAPSSSDSFLKQRFDITELSRAGQRRRRRRRRWRWRWRSMAELYSWLVSFFVLIALLIVIVYQLMCLADLEFDYINPYDSSSRINRVILPEFITQGVLCLFYLVTGHWFMSLLSVPYLYYNVRQYLQRKHLVDVTEIFNLLHWEKKQRLFKLFYLIFLLFLTIFWMILTALDDHN